MLKMKQIGTSLICDLNSCCEQMRCLFHLTWKWRAAVNLTVQKIFSPLWHLFSHTKFEYPSLNDISCFEMWQSPWPVVVTYDSEKQKDWCLRYCGSLKAEKFEPKSLLSWSIFGKVSNVSSTKKRDLTTLSQLLKRLQEKSPCAFWNNYGRLVCSFAIWLLLLSQKEERKKKRQTCSQHRSSSQRL